jgi:uncharacterized protein YutE (UPF0331/DUF86 family)
VTDADLVAKKLALIETYVHELRTLADPSKVATDVREERFVEHTLQIAIQAALDVASHVVSAGRLGEPRTNQELFEILARNGFIEERLAKALRAAVGFRNVVVHGYSSIDKAVVCDVLVNHVGDLVAFVVAVREAIGSSRR